MSVKFAYIQDPLYTFNFLIIFKHLFLKLPNQILIILAISLINEVNFEKNPG